MNQEYQPTFTARTGALTLFQVACVSAGNVCAFQIVRDSDQAIVPWDQVSSDGITYSRPYHRRGNGSPLIPDSTASEAYLSLGGGQREGLVVQFETPGTYTVYARIAAFDDKGTNPYDEILAFITVEAGPTCADASSGTVMVTHLKPKGLLQCLRYLAACHRCRRSPRWVMGWDTWLRRSTRVCPSVHQSG